ncbi:hypothetical protein D9M68_533800 [compost metagenome]
MRKWPNVHEVQVVRCSHGAGGDPAGFAGCFYLFHRVGGGEPVQWKLREVEAVYFPILLLRAAGLLLEFMLRVLPGETQE